jgi:DNA polymerase (family 10)
MKETIGDAGILVTSDRPANEIDYVASLPEVVDILGKGATKTSVRLKTGMEVDIRVVPSASMELAMVGTPLCHYCTTWTRQRGR